MPAAVLVYRSVGNTAQAGTGIANRSANASNTPASTKGNTPTVAGHGGSKVLPQSPTGLYYIHTDHLGTPRVITDPSTGQVVWRWDGEPFGASAPNEDPNGSGSNFVFNLRFPGQYYDAQTGLDYNYYRDYDPQTGRYVESDPSGLWGGLNLYQYVESRPLTMVDPLGLMDGCPTGMAPDANHVCHPTPYESPKKHVCGTAACAAGLLPNHNYYSPKTACTIKCSLKYQLVCVGVGRGVGYISANPLAGKVAGFSCSVVKSLVCHHVCDSRHKKQCSASK